MPISRIIDFVYGLSTDLSQHKLCRARTCLSGLLEIGYLASTAGFFWDLYQAARLMFSDSHGLVFDRLSASYFSRGTAPCDRRRFVSIAAFISRRSAFSAACVMPSGTMLKALASSRSSDTSFMRLPSSAANIGRSRRIHDLGGAFPIADAGDEPRGDPTG